MKLFASFLIAILLTQALAEAVSVNDAANALTEEDETGNIGLLKGSKAYKINCSYACARRCSKSSRKNVCHRACKTCCSRCNCVPPGTYGNQHLCPCYAKQRTHGNKPKCP